MNVNVSTYEIKEHRLSQPTVDVAGAAEGRNGKQGGRADG